MGDNGLVSGVPWSPAEIERLGAMYAEGQSYAAIAREFPGRTAAAVTSKLKKLLGQDRVIRNDIAAARAAGAKAPLFDSRALLYSIHDRLSRSRRRDQQITR